MAFAPVVPFIFLHTFLVSSSGPLVRFSMWIPFLLKCDGPGPTRRVAPGPPSFTATSTGPSDRVPAPVPPYAVNVLVSVFPVGGSSVGLFYAVLWTKWAALGVLCTGRLARMSAR